MKDERGLSPVIATVLLIAMVVVIGLIVFLWVRGIQGEAVTKFDGQNVQTICPDISFDASYSSGSLTLSNTGNVHVYQIRAKISEAGGRTQSSTDINDIDSSWPSAGLTQGSVLSMNVQSEFEDAEEALLIPILRGKSDAGEKTYVCEDQYGVLVQINNN